MKLQQVGQADRVVLEHFTPRPIGKEWWQDKSLFVPCWKWKGNTRRIGNTFELSKIGPGYVVRLNTGEVFEDEPSEAQTYEAFYK